MSLFTETNEIDPTKDYFPDLVGEGKKYKANADIGRAVMEKDLFIKQLTDETKELRKTLAERVKLEELTTKLSELANKSPTSESEQQSTNGTTTQAPPGITPEQIDAILDKRLSEKEQRRAEEANLLSVQQKLVQKFGTNYTSRLTEEAGKLGMTKEQLEQVAASNPAAFLRLVGAEETKQSTNLFTPPTGASTSFTPSVNDRTAKWYKELKKTNPVLYNSRDMQVQKHKDAQRIGEGFFDAE